MKCLVWSKCRSALFTLSLAALAVTSGACSITVKHELSKSAVAELEKVRAGTSNVAEAINKIGGNVGDKFKEAMDGKSEFIAPTAKADFNVKVTLDSNAAGALVLTETSTNTEFASLDLDSLTMTEDGVDFLMVSDVSTAATIDWWFESDSGERRHIMLAANTSSNLLEGSIDIFLVGGDTK